MLQRAIDHFGSQEAFGAFIGRPQQRISDWVRAGRPIPAEYVLRLEAATGISRHDLRPDIYPREPLPAGSHSAAAAPSPASIAPDAGEFSPLTSTPEAA